MDDKMKLELINNLKEVVLQISKGYESNIQVVLDANPEEDSVKCKITEFNL